MRPPWTFQCSQEPWPYSNSTKTFPGWSIGAYKDLLREFPVLILDLQGDPKDRPLNSRCSDCPMLPNGSKPSTHYCPLSKFPFVPLMMSNRFIVIPNRVSTVTESFEKVQPGINWKPNRKISRRSVLCSLKESLWTDTENMIGLLYLNLGHTTNARSPAICTRVKIMLFGTYSTFGGGDSGVSWSRWAIVPGHSKAQLM